MLIWKTVKGRLFNEGARRVAFAIAKEHYNLDNHLFEKMLNARMTYSCGYRKDAGALDEAQEAKLDLICRKVGIKKGNRVLDIGCGWGSFAKFAAERYGASVVGVTVSKEKSALGRERCKGLPIEIHVQDYREVDERFDTLSPSVCSSMSVTRITARFFEVTSRCLAKDGLCLLHTIGNHKNTNSGDAWLGKYIFPRGMLPSVTQVGRNVEGLFKLEDWHSFGPDYDRTLMAWFGNFKMAWPALRPKYDDRFYRMWKYYLLSYAGAFRARHIQLWQIVLSQNGVPGATRACAERESPSIRVRR
jgi:cyclopropane-fatty-acyl-phospholipid synthase